MQNVLTFWSEFFSIIAEFLMSEPVVYFVAIILLLMVIALLQRVIFIKAS